MDKKVTNIIKKYAEDEIGLFKLVVSAFIIHHNLKMDGCFLSAYIVDQYNEMAEDIVLLAKNCTIEEVINIFEITIPDAEKTSNGAVYTPRYIREYIVDHVMESIDKDSADCLCADISCGCGAFLYTLAEYIHAHSASSYTEIIKRLYGVDISATSIGRAKILLALSALLHGECVNETDFNLFCGDSLVFDFKSLRAVQLNNGFDIVVGNPPYVRSKHIDEITKLNLPLWRTSKGGNADLYIPFFEIGLSVLNENGCLGYITVNSFFKSVNARSLRNYLSDNFSLSIIDFGQQLIFPKKLAYTCLTFISKAPCSFLLHTKANISDIQKNRQLIYNHIHYEDLDNHRGWNLNRNDVLENIRLIENAGTPLGDKYIIKNGIATLANDVFIFRPRYEEGKFYHIVKEGVDFAIEKEICRDIIKPNILKDESEIPQKEEKIISPYDDEHHLLDESYFIQHYPCAYEYLKTFRYILDARDKGEGNYEAWYAFGRTQAITDNGLKLLFPYMSDSPHFIYTPQKDLMIYCGYAIYNSSEIELLFLKRVLESSVFDYYMKNTSKPYSTGYYSYAKNYVKSFGIYPFTQEQKEHILSLTTKEDIDAYIAEMYKVVI